MLALTLTNYFISNTFIYLFILMLVHMPGRIVKALLEESSAKFRKPLQEGKSYNSRSHGSNQTESRFTHATYHAMHVRHRDEFAAQNQYNQLLPDSIFNFALRHFDRNISTIIYIAVDSDNMTVFEPLREIFQLKFISDYMTQFEDGRSESMINYNHIGMVEQMICANADTFIGTMTSTYSDYIMKLRGYYDDDRVTRSYVFFSEIDFTHQYRSHDYLLNTPEGYTNIDAKDLVDVSTHSTRAPADKRGDDDDGMDLNPDEEDDDYDKTLSFMPSVSKRVKDYHDDTVE